MVNLLNSKLRETIFALYSFSSRVARQAASAATALAGADVIISFLSVTDYLHLRLSHPHCLHCQKIRSELKPTTFPLKSLRTVRKNKDVNVSVTNKLF